MDQNDNAKIIKWLGWRRVKGFRHVWRLPNGEQRGLTPDFVSCDSDAITILPVLVEKGYFVHMDHQGNHWWFATRDSNPEVLRLFESTAPTIAQAITKTLIQLIESI